MKRILRIDWDVIAGVIAAVTALVLHLLHLVEVDVILTVAMILLAILLIRDLRRENQDERQGETLAHLGAGVEALQHAIQPSEVSLIGPQALQSESRRFCESARGEMVWFNVCFLMFRRQRVFDLMLRPAVENPKVESIRFTADTGEKELWETEILPKLRACEGHEKVQEPHWCELPKTVSFILAEQEASGETEALLSFWGEPFMARVIEKQVPRYILKVEGRSELVARFVEIERQSRLGGSGGD